MAKSLSTFISILFFIAATVLFAGEKPDKTGSASVKPVVKIGDTTITIESVVTLTGEDALSTPEDREARKKQQVEIEKYKKAMEKRLQNFPPQERERIKKLIEEEKKRQAEWEKKIADQRKKMEEEEAKGSFITWMLPDVKYILVKYTVVDSGNTNPLYVSPTVRFDCSLWAKSSGNKTLLQGRPYPHLRPKTWLDPGVMRLIKGRKYEDYLIFRAPEKGETNVDVELYIESIFPGTSGSVKMQIPVKDGEVTALDKIKFEYVPSDAKVLKMKIRGKARFKGVIVEFVGIKNKRVSVLDIEAKQVIMPPETCTIITLKISNTSKKPMKYTPILMQKSMPGICASDSGSAVTPITLPKTLKLVECFDLKETIPPKSFILDYIVLVDTGPMTSLRAVLLVENLLPGVKGAKGTIIARFKFKKDRPPEVKVKKSKKSVILNENMVVNLLNKAARNSDSFDKKYSGFSVTSMGTVMLNEYDEKRDMSVLELRVSEDTEKKMTYTFLLLLKGRATGLRDGDKVAFKGIIISTTQEKLEEYTDHKIVIYGTKKKRIRE